MDRWEKWDTQRLGYLPKITETASSKSESQQAMRSKENILKQGSRRASSMCVHTWCIYTHTQTNIWRRYGLEKERPRSKKKRNQLEIYYNNPGKRWGKKKCRRGENDKEVNLTNLIMQSEEEQGIKNHCEMGTLGGWWWWRKPSRIGIFSNSCFQAYNVKVNQPSLQLSDLKSQE